MKRHALFIGVDQYADENIQDLRCAVNDATELAGFFKHRARFDRAEALPNPRNCEAILDRVYDMISGLGVGDEFLFFFAGHGIKTQDGHRLVCAGDKLNAVQHSWAGLPLERIKSETSGAFDRLFLLDACRTDVLATNRGVVGAMEKGTRDLIMEAATSADEYVGALTILCSCNDGECAGEILMHRHGLFSMAMLELLDEECRCGRRVLVTDDFVYNQIPVRMRALAETSGMAFNQNPQKEGPPIMLLDGVVGGPVPADKPSPASLSVASANARPASLVCPECGMYNVITNTFKCKVCGRDHLCKEHYSKDERCCADCAEKVRVHRAAEEKARRETEEKARLAALPKTGDVKTLVLPGGAEMEMIYCAPGEFMMGSPESEEGRHDDEVLHCVKLTKGFWLGKYPVTQGQWQNVMGSNPSEFKGYTHLPVDTVSWDDCREFVEKVKSSAKQQLGGEARFPTEAEWEYACRAGTKTAYYWGNALNGDKVNCDVNNLYLSIKKGSYLAETTPVGRYGANAWGFADMHGNVWEWCVDWYGDYSGGVVDPTGPASGDLRVMRGGSWLSNARFCRSANRDRRYPGDRRDYCGFRLCCSAGPHGGRTASSFMEGLCCPSASVAPQGSAQEMYNRGIAFYGRQNHSEAIKCFREAADKGHSKAQRFLGMMYSHGEGVSKNFVEAVKWYMQSASHGEIDAQFSLGVMYANGRGVPQDYAIALEWYRKAAGQGHARALNNLSVMYNKGDGVTKDELESFRLCRQAAELGSRAAQYNLACKYENGSGVTKDEVEAVKWYRKAAERGHEDAKDALKRLAR